MSIAFFDLDRTLLSANSAVLWIRAERRLGHISRWQAFRAATWMARYQLGFASIQDAMREAIGTLKGIPERDIRRRSVAFYEEQLRALYRPGGLAALDAHRRSGDRLVLLTSSSSYFSELVSRDLSLDGFICNRFEVDARGLHTGRAQGELCFGEGKLNAASAYAQKAGIRLSDCSFYTDSFSDLPVLQAVGTPVVVNPDQRLRRAARRRGWRVVDWGRPSAAGLPVLGTS